MWRGCIKWPVQTETCQKMAECKFLWFVVFLQKGLVYIKSAFFPFKISFFTLKRIEVFAGFFHQSDLSGSFCPVFHYSVLWEKEGWRQIWTHLGLSYLLIPCLNAQNPSGSNRLHKTQCCDDLFLDFEVHQYWSYYVENKVCGECEAAGIKISSCKSKTTVLCRKQMDCPMWRNQSILGSCLHEGRKVSRLTDGSGQHPQKVRASVYQSIYGPALTHNHELWVTIGYKSEITFLHRLTVLILSDRVRRGAQSRADTLQKGGKGVCSGCLLGASLRRCFGQTRPRMHWTDIVSLVGLIRPWDSPRGGGGSGEGDEHLGPPPSKNDSGLTVSSKNLKSWVGTFRDLSG